MIYTDGTFAVVALRNIRAGEEITISYLPEDELVRSSYERHLRLAKWGIESCACPRCLDSDDMRKFLCPRSPTCDGRIVGQSDSFSACSHCGGELSASSKKDLF